VAGEGAVEEMCLSPCCEPASGAWSGGGSEETSAPELCAGPASPPFSAGLGNKRAPKAKILGYIGRSFLPLPQLSCSDIAAL